MNSLQKGALLAVFGVISIAGCANNQANFESLAVAEESSITNKNSEASKYKAYVDYVCESRRICLEESW